MADYNNFDANQNNQNGYQAQPTDNYGQQFGYGAPVAPQEKKGGKGMAIAGIICSSIGLVLSLINSIAGAMMMMSLM